LHPLVRLLLPVVRVLESDEVGLVTRVLFFFKQKTAYEIGLGIPAEPLFRSYSSRISLRGRSAASLRQNCVTVFSFSKNHFSSPSGRWSIVLLISSWGSTL